MTQFFAEESSKTGHYSTTGGEGTRPEKDVNPIRESRVVSRAPVEPVEMLETMASPKLQRKPPNPSVSLSWAWTSPPQTARVRGYVLGVLP